MHRLLMVGLVLLLLPSAGMAGNDIYSPFAKPRPLYSIDSVEYQLNLAAAAVSGQIVLSGQVLSGQPQPIPLFAHDITISAIQDIQGGALLSDEQGYKLYITPEQKVFQLSLEITLPVQEDQQSLFVAFKTPTAVKNALRLNTAETLQLLEAPGQQADNGHYYFSPGGELRLRFEDEAQAKANAAPAIDVFSRITLTGNKFRINSYFVPLRTISTPLLIQLPVDHYLDTSLKPSWLKKSTAGSGQLVATPDRDWLQPFRIDYEVPVSDQPLTMATILDNQGREGEFQIEEPLEAQITVLDESVQHGIPEHRLSKSMREFTGLQGSFSRVSDNGSDNGSNNSGLNLEVQRFEAVSTPEIVLDAIYLYTSFAENGSALSLLRLELPAESERKLQLTPIQGAEIWSLQVNGQPRNLLRQQSGQWIIPLDSGASVVELAYLQKGEKLGLKGRLDIRVPATGLAARRLNIAIALADRVELIAMEGELEPTRAKDWPTVQAFSGKPYFFSHPFYRGTELNAAIYYQEPLDNNSADTNNRENKS